MATKKYNYFISYEYDYGCGNLILETRNLINWNKELLDTQKLIEEETGLNGVIIMNFIKL